MYTSLLMLLAQTLRVQCEVGLSPIQPVELLIHRFGDLPAVQSIKDDEYSRSLKDLGVFLVSILRCRRNSMGVFVLPAPP